MVTRSPFSACGKRAASPDGGSRSGANASAISNVWPSTKRAALTLPSRYFAARSGRAGVTRGSSIAFAQEFVDRPRSLAFAALGARGFGGRRPTVDVAMQPALGALDDTLQGQRPGGRAGKGAARTVVGVGGFRMRPGI